MLQEAQSRSTLFGERQSECAPAPTSCTAGRATGCLVTTGVGSLDGRADIADLLEEELSEASDDSITLPRSRPRHMACLCETSSSPTRAPCRRRGRRAAGTTGVARGRRRGALVDKGSRLPVEETPASGSA